MSMTSEKELPQEVAAWRDPEMDSVKGTETPKDPNKGYMERQCDQGRTKV